MVGMNIKDPEVHRMARELAVRRRTSLTGAVRDALGEALERTPATTPDVVAAQVLEIGRAGAEVDAPFLTDADLYDDRGLPR